MMALKICKVGNSLGLVLPQELVSRLRTGDGQHVFLLEGPNDTYVMKSSDPAFRAKMGYPVQLVNTSKVRQYEGIKYTDDRYDAFWLAQQMRLGILPRGTFTRKSSAPYATCYASAAAWYVSERPTCYRLKVRCGDTPRFECRAKSYWVRKKHPGPSCPIKM